jgi:hypothetical protein
MRFSLLPVLAAIVLALAAPVASARPYQDLRSPDARDANAAKNAQTLQDLAHLRGTPRFTAPTGQYKAALAQEKYYSSYGPAEHPKPAPADDNSPLPAIGIGLALILVIAGSVAVAVRTRRRTVRVAV